MWPRESGALHSIARFAGLMAAGTFDYYAGLADTYPFEQSVIPTMGGEFGLLVREPVGVVGVIVPWNGPLSMIATKVAPALLAGCTVVVKSSPEAPGEGYLIAEIAEAVGLPAGVLNVVTADREVSEHLVRDPRIDKITFTGSTAAGRRIAAICGERIARCTLELGGKSAAVVLDDIDITTVARTIARSECMLTGQVCSSLTRVIVTEERHDELVEALAATFAQGNDRGSIRSVERDGSTGNQATARPGRGIHCQGRRGGGGPRFGGWTAAGSRCGLVCRTNTLCSCRQSLDDRPGGDFWSRPQRHPGSGRGPCRRPGQRQHLRAQRVSLHRRPRQRTLRGSSTPFWNRGAQCLAD